MKFEKLYYLMNEKISVVEVKLLDLDEKAPKEQVYKWIYILSSGEIKSLEFSEMKKEEVNGNQINVRIFKNAELRFDDLFGKFVLGDELYILKNCSKDPLPSKANESISQKF